MESETPSASMNDIVLIERAVSEREHNFTDSLKVLSMFPESLLNTIVKENEQMISTYRRMLSKSMTLSKSTKPAIPIVKGRRLEKEVPNLTCGKCGKTFSRRDNLIAHQRVHTDERPYPCSICPRSFRWLSALRHHQKMHERRALRKMADYFTLDSTSLVSIDESDSLSNHSKEEYSENKLQQKLPKMTKARLSNSSLSTSASDNEELSEIHLNVSLSEEIKITSDVDNDENIPSESADFLGIHLPRHGWQFYNEASQDINSNSAEQFEHWNSENNFKTHIDDTSIDDFGEEEHMPYP